MRVALLDEVLRAQNLPTLPAVAVEVLELSRRDDVRVEDMARVIGRDPALTAKVLKVVNSPLFGVPRQITSLEQSLKLLGLRSVRVLALSFSLAGSIGRGEGDGFDYEDFWRRSLTAAVAGKLLGAASGSRCCEDAFVAGLLSDLGRLALHRCVRQRYDEALRLHREERLDLCAAERRALGACHAEVGAALLESWGLPSSLCEAVRLSHAEGGARGGPESPAALVRAGVCVSDALAGAAPDARGLERALTRAGEMVGLDRAGVEAALADLSEHVSSMASLMSIRVGETPDLAQLQATAAAQLAMLTVQSEADFQRASLAADEAQREADQLREENRSMLVRALTDQLTGLANRAAFDERLEDAVRSARASGACVGLILIDLDHFKRLNDTHGHLAGDAALRAVGERLRGAATESGFAARFGGEEFAVLLDDRGAEEIDVVAEAIRRGIAAATMSFGGASLRITASVGTAVVRPAHSGATADALLERADRMLYRAKSAGRNRVVSGAEVAGGGGGAEAA